MIVILFIFSNLNLKYTIIIWNLLFLYLKINEKKNISNNNNNNRIMLNSIPLAPKKYHTFNENNNNNQASSNENSNDNQDSNEIKDQDIFDNFNKPLMRTGSNINVNLKYYYYRDHNFVYLNK